MTMLHVFKSSIPSINYIFAIGKPAIFQGGFHRTDVEWEIKELMAEVDLRHPHITIPESESERVVDSSMVDPMAVLRAKIIADYEASKLADAAGNKDMGESKQGPLIPANSRDIAVAAAGGAGIAPAGTAALVKLAASVQAHTQSK